MPKPASTAAPAARTGQHHGGTVGDDGARWVYSSDRNGVSALRGRLLAALAAHIIRTGTQRMGLCQAAPCNCVYIDRSRARTRRYCCDQCNDRAAASAYRRRQTT